MPKSEAFLKGFLAAVQILTCLCSITVGQMDRPVVCMAKPKTFSDEVEIITRIVRYELARDGAIIAKNW
jgi:hypothetical protein